MAVGVLVVHMSVSLSLFVYITRTSGTRDGIARRNFGDGLTLSMNQVVPWVIRSSEIHN